MVADRVKHFIREFGIAIASVILVTMLLLPFRVALVSAVAIPVTEDSSLEALKLCVEHGVDLSAFNSNGATALHNAVNRGSLPYT